MYINDFNIAAYFKIGLIYVNMQHNYVNMQLFYVNTQDDNVAIYV